MTTVEIILGAVLLVMSVFLIVSVLMQSGKDKGVSGTIAGGAETFFGKSKGKSIDRKLSILTSVVAILFVAVVLTVYVMQDVSDTSGVRSDYVPAVTTDAPADSDTTAPVGSDTDASTGSDTTAPVGSDTDASTGSDTAAPADSDTAASTGSDTAAA